MRKATRRVGQLFDDALRPCGLKATQHALLTQIRHLEAPTIKQLADELVMDLSALGHTLKPLERDGYIALVGDPRDRRRKRVSLTPDGVAKLDEASRHWRVAQSRFDAAFGPRKAEKLRKALNLVASEAFGEAFVAGVRVKRSSDAP
jgi:DNA-binding MarR family transcriptional regulator